MRQPGLYLQPLPFSERDSRRSGTQKLLKRRCHIFVLHFAVLHGPAWPHGTPKTEYTLLNRRHLKLETVGVAGSKPACLSGCLTRFEEQTLWKAGRREKCAGNDPFLPSRLPNLLCIKRPDMQGNLHRAPSSSRGWRPRRGSIRICGSHFSAVLHEARHRTSRRIRGGKFFGVGKSCHAPRHVLFSPSQIGNAAVAQLDRASDYELSFLMFYGVA